jgi:photosystem II stability/assembly factor-like uncharacterized protein
VVHPTDSNHVICGSVDLHRTKDGGATWQRVTRWEADSDESNYAHANHHSLVMPVAAPGLIYDANDGGMEVSDDGGQSWTNRSKGLVITGFYQIDVAASDSRYYGGGTDRNGVVLTSTGRPDDHLEVLGGDGGRLVFDPKEPTRIYTSYYNLNIYRFRGKNIKKVSPRASAAEKQEIWNAPIKMDPLKPKTVFVGSQRVWRTRDDGESWSAVSRDFDGSNISALEVSEADGKRIYAGTERGGMFSSLDGGDSWSHDIVSSIFPRKTITGIKSSSANSEVLFVSVAGFGNSHVFRSDDGGESWLDVDGGKLPDVPHHAIALSDDDPNAVYVCCEVGVYVSRDLGNSWQNLTGKLPNSSFTDLVYHQKDGALYVATWGRGIWRLQIR